MVITLWISSLFVSPVQAQTSRHFVVSRIIGTDSVIDRDPYRAKLMDSVGDTIECAIPSNADRTPKFPLALCRIDGDLSALPDDADFFKFPRGDTTLRQVLRFLLRHLEPGVAATEFVWTR